jgi:hypothetical protein
MFLLSSFLEAAKLKPDIQAKNQQARDFYLGLANQSSLNEKDNYIRNYPVNDGNQELRAFILLTYADLLIQEEGYTTAKKILTKAQSLDPDSIQIESMISFLDDILDPPIPFLIEKSDQFKEKGFRLNLKLSALTDTNVISKSDSSQVSSKKNDKGYSTYLGLTKIFTHDNKLKTKLKYSFFGLDYLKIKNYDYYRHSLSVNLSKRLKSTSSTMFRNLHGEFGYRTSSSDSGSLFDELYVQPGLTSISTSGYWHKVYLDLAKTDYKSASSAAIYDANKFSLGFMYSKNLNAQKTVNFMGISKLLMNDTDAAKSTYKGYFAHIGLNFKSIINLSPYVSFMQKDYDASGIVASPDRSDANISFGVTISKKIRRVHQLSAQISVIENDSTVDNFSYSKNKLQLSYQLSL